MDEDVSVMSLKPAPMIQALQVHQCHDVVSLGSGSERAQYGNSQRGGEDGKGKRGGKNGKGERGGGVYWGNKVDLVVEESSGSEANDYYHIIYRY